MGLIGCLQEEAGPGVENRRLLFNGAHLCIAKFALSSVVFLVKVDRFDVLFISPGNAVLRLNPGNV
jgi:hypothetical protein